MTSWYIQTSPGRLRWRCANGPAQRAGVASTGAVMSDPESADHLHGADPARGATPGGRDQGSRSDARGRSPAHMRPAAAQRRRSAAATFAGAAPGATVLSLLFVPQPPTAARRSNPRQRADHDRSTAQGGGREQVEVRP